MIVRRVKQVIKKLLSVLYDERETGAGENSQSCFRERYYEE
jgi:hypothetical protein